MSAGLTGKIRITTPDGYPLDIPLNGASLRAMNVVNGVGYFEMTLNARDYPRGLFALDRRVEVDIRAAGRSPALAFIGFMRLYREVGGVSTYTRDYRDEVNAVYVGGSGQGTERVVRTRLDATRSAGSIINRREGFGAYSNTGDTDVLDAHGDKMLRDGDVKLTLERDFGELPRAFGAEWGLGDSVTVSADVPDQVVIGGPGWNDLLSRRIVAAATGTAGAQKTGAADSLMLAYVDEALVSATDADRNVATAMGLSLGTDAGFGPSVTHSSTYGNLLDVVSDIAEKSWVAGMIVRFGLAPVWDGARYVPRFEVRKERWGKARPWILGSGSYAETVEIMGIDIQIGANGATTVHAKTEGT